MGVQINKLTVGDTWSFLVTSADYQAPTWTIYLYLVPRFAAPTQAIIALTSIAEGADHRFSVAAGVTATYVAGQYGYATRASDGSQIFTLDGTEWSGEVQLMPNPATASQGDDNRTQAQKALDDARTAFAAWTPTRKAYSIAGRAMTFNTPQEIIAVINFWSEEVQKERDAAARAAGRKSSRIVYQVYGNA